MTNLCFCFFFVSFQFSLSISEKYQNIHLSFGITEVRTKCQGWDLFLNTHTEGVEEKDSARERNRTKTERNLWYLRLSNVLYLDFCFGIELVTSVGPHARNKAVARGAEDPFG